MTACTEWHTGDARYGVGDEGQKGMRKVGTA